MAEGLEPHRHVYFEEKTSRYYDNYKHCMVRKVKYRCLVPNCDSHYYEKYEYQGYAPKFKDKDKILNKNKNTHKGGVGGGDPPSK